MVSTEVQPLYELTVHYTYHELKRYADYISRRNCMLLRYAAVPLLLIAVGLIVLFSGITMVGVVLVLGAIMGFAMLVVKERSDRNRLAASSPLCDKDITLKFCADRIIMDEGGYGEIPHTEIQRVDETEKALYILIKQRGGLIIPKKDCNAQLADHIRTLKPKEQSK